MHLQVNLFPWRDQRSKIRKKSIWIIGGLMLLLSGGGQALIWQTERSTITQRYAELAALKQAYQALQQQERQVISDEQRFAREQKRFHAFSQRIQRNNQPILLMNILPLALPDDVVLDEMTWQAPWVSLSGRVGNVSSLETLVLELRAIKQFKHVETDSLVSADSSQSRFTLRFRLVEQEEL